MPSIRDKTIDTTDNRQFPRVVCNLKARVRLGEMLDHNCIVSDISEAGFRLFIIPDAWIPSEFMIVCDQFGSPKLAEQMWRRRNLLGAQFVN